MLLFAAACSCSSAFVCTGLRLVRAHVVLLSTPSLISTKHFEIFPSDIVAAQFLVRFFRFRAFFFQPESTPGLYDTSYNHSTSDTCVWYVCTYYILYVYTMKQLQHYAVLLHVVGTQVDIQYAVRMHVRVCTCQVHTVLPATSKYVITTSSNSSRSATAAGCVC